MENKNTFNKFDELAKMFLHFIRVKRSNYMKGLELENRPDIAEDQIEHYRRVVIIGFNTEY